MECKFEPRLYQETIFATAVQKNTLVVLPTGLGKTNIFIMLALQRLKNYPSSKILFLAPTKPLVEQHYQTFLKQTNITEEESAILTGSVSPEERTKIWEGAKILFSTPQTIENDILTQRIKLDQVSLLGVDEAHRAIGDYAYVFVTKNYNKNAKNEKIVALTASPGGDLEKIKEICTNLYIEDVEVRTQDDPDVKQYIQPLKTEWVNVNLPESMKDIQKLLNKSYSNKLKNIKQNGHINSTMVNKTELLKLQKSLQSTLIRGEKDFEIMKSLSLLAEAIKLQYALELLEIQGLVQLQKYFEKLERDSNNKKTKAAQNLMKDLELRTAILKTQNLILKEEKHPKLIKLKELVSEDISSGKIIVFTQYRDSATEIAKELNEIKSVDAKIFVGQNKKSDTGLTQKKQKEILDAFRNDKFNVLVCTSVGEEGLDIPLVNQVIFYESIPSAIRSIQRRGRTARHDKGAVKILVTTDTRDVGYKWSAHHKEKKMHRALKDLKKSFLLTNEIQPKLDKYIPEEQKVKIFADYREKPNHIIKHLLDIGASVKLEMLNSADYLLSGDVAVEFKTKEDFVNSLIDGRLLEQIKKLRSDYTRALVVIEGKEDIYKLRNIHPNAIRGMIAAITVGYNIPILYTKDAEDTAALFYQIAKREQTSGTEYNPHASRKPVSLKAQQEYIISALPLIGPRTARELLKKFGTIRSIMKASDEELKQVEGVGNKIAETLKKLLDEDYLKE